MYAAFSKHGGAPLLSLPVGSAQRAVSPTAGPPTVDIAIEGHLSSASGIQVQRGRDAAILADLYLAHGLAALKEVDGSFAFVIVDHRDGSVHAGIDKLGQSLAYVAETPDEVVFATTLVELLELLPSKPNVDLSSVFEFLSQGWIISPNSMFEGVEKLPPGSFVTCRGSHVQHVGYYEPLHDGLFISRSA